jgi:hypothetical protein
MTVQHLVLVEWKDEADDATIDAFMTAVGSFPDKIPGVEKVEWGRNFTDRAGNFTHAAIVTLRDKEALANYGPHEDHQAALAAAGPMVASIIVADFEPS